MQARPSFLEALLSPAPIVFDGATGTMLYDRGVYFDRSFEELCLTQPALVSEVHRSYVDIGVDVVQTNTYGANSIVLKKFGLENKTKILCESAVTLAKNVAGDRTFVAGSIGPTRLLPKDLIHSSTRKQVFDAFRETALALTNAGADLLLFETFRYVGELEIAIEAAYGIKIPLIAQASFDDNLQTGDGASPSEVAERLCQMGVDGIGANCLLGPERIHLIAEEMVKHKKPVVIQPNVGFPHIVEGRAIYQSSPETFGVCARRAFKLGVKGYGGCCGTTPDYIRRVIAAARMFGRNDKKLFGKSQTHGSQTKQIQKSVEEKAKRSKLAHQLQHKEFVISIEVSPPAGIDLKKSLEQLALIESHGIPFVNVPDGPRATARMSNMAFCRLIGERTGLEPIMHVCGRDRNLLALQGTLLGADALGIRNTVIITGDPPKIGDYPDATAVFDLNSIGILSMANRLNEGLDPAGKPVGSATSLVLLTGAEPHAANFDKEIERLKEKQDAGAEAVMTQPVYDAKVFERFLDAVERLGLQVLMGVLPLASARNALFLHQNVPGMQIPETILKKISAAKDASSAEAIGIEVAVAAIRAVRERIGGVYLMPSLGRIAGCIEVVKQASLI
jgi:methionine synthase I (cobalamin-dependent)/5,10-methylenetetrahydrofolate reductase